jgi:hypothetical protein
MTPPPRPDEIEPLPDSVWIYERESRRRRRERESERPRGIDEPFFLWLLGIIAGPAVLLALVYLVALLVGMA